jgi:hypothetical protein
MPKPVEQPPPVVAYTPSVGPFPSTSTTPITGGKLVIAQKKKSSIVLLAPRGKRDATRKKRKFSIGIPSFKQRITRAKDIHEKSRTDPINEVDTILSKAGLKKPSKGPIGGKLESVLRDTYRDYLQLRSNAL